MWPVRRRVAKNMDAKLRELERRAQGDPSAIAQFVRAVIRTGDFESAAPALTKLISPLSLGSPRDDMVLVLGRELVRRGWAPDLPLGYEAYREFGLEAIRPETQVGDRHGQRVLVRTGPEVRLKGQFSAATAKRQVRSWRFVARCGFSTSTFNQIPTREPANQPPYFFFEISPIGRRHQADALARKVLEGPLNSKTLRKIAPDTWFLLRWKDSVATTSPGARGGAGTWAGLPWHYIENSVFFASPAEQARGMWPAFLKNARAGYLPSESVPDQSVTQDQIRAWLQNPQRIADLGALFYGDLYLGGLLLPPEQLHYDPATLMAPQVQTNPRASMAEGPADDFEAWVSFAPHRKVQVRATSPQQARLHAAEILHVRPFDIVARYITDRSNVQHPWVDPPWWRPNPGRARRNPDERLQGLRRRLEAGDPEAFTPYVNAAARTGDHQAVYWAMGFAPNRDLLRWASNRYWHARWADKPPQLNPGGDPRLRDLERRAAAGDPEAQARLAHHRARAGDPFDLQLVQAREEIAFANGPDGYHRVLLPDVTRWRELFKAEGKRDSLIEEQRRGHHPWAAQWTFDDYEEGECTVPIGPACQINGQDVSYRWLNVKPTQPVAQAIMDTMIPQCYHSVGFEVVIRTAEDKQPTALVIARWSSAIGARWLAIIPAVEVPGVGL